LGALHFLERACEGPGPKRCGPQEHLEHEEVAVQGSHGRGNDLRCDIHATEITAFPSLPAHGDLPVLGFAPCRTPELGRHLLDLDVHAVSGIKRSGTPELASPITATKG